MSWSDKRLEGELLHNDDTIARILDLEGVKNAKHVFYDEDDGLGPKRTGIYTTGIVSVSGGRRIALFFTGRKHAGENLADVLKERSTELSTPMQMSEGLAANTAFDFETTEGNCNSHARRKFVEVVEDFPEEVGFVLETYEAVLSQRGRNEKTEDVRRGASRVSPGEKRTADERARRLQKNSHRVAEDPSGWMPWNYRETLALLDESKKETIQEAD